MIPTASLPPVSDAPTSVSRLTYETVAKGVALAVFVVATFPPLLPYSWGMGVEWSWQMALQESVARGLVYGRDFLFTYGPLGFLAWPRDIGNLLVPTVVWWLVIHGFFYTAIGLCTWTCRPIGAGVLFLVMIALSQVRVELPTRILLAEAALLAFAYVRSRHWPALPAAALAAVALLVKFNTGVTAAVTLLLWFATALARPGRRALAGWSAAAAGVFLATFLVCFRIYGGPLDAVPEFLSGSIRLAAGYSAQMAQSGSPTDLYLALGCLSFWAVLIGVAGSVDRRFWVMGMLLSGVFFNLLKSGFVRQDSFHVFLFFAGLPGFAALFLMLPESRSLRWGTAGVCVTLLAVSVVERSRQFTPPEAWPIAAYLPDGPRNLWDAAHWTQRRAAIREAAASAVAAVRFPGSLATQIGGAPIDGYPQELTVLFANRVNWSPRPVPQSYSAYSPDLDELNARHYRTPYGPELILYQLDAIDGQHPWFVDPLTLREVFGRYEIGLRLPPFLLLKRRTEPVVSNPEPVARAKVRIGERVPVPDGGEFLLAAALDFRLTPAGQLRDKLWRVIPPSLNVEFADGSSRTFRIVWRNAANGLLISELPTSLNETAALWEPSGRTRVIAFTVLANSGDFDEEIDLTWLRTAMPSQQHK